MNKFDVKLIFGVLKTDKVLKVLWYSRLFKKLEEDVLGFPLYFWQKQYIVGAPDSVIPAKRRCGKTTAHILRQILCLDRKIFKGWLSSANIETDNDPNPYQIKSGYYRRFYLDTFNKIYYLVSNTNIRHQQYILSHKSGYHTFTATEYH